MHYKNINLQTNGQAIAPGRHSGWRLEEVWVGHSQPAPAVSAKDTRSVLQPSAYTSSGLTGNIRDTAPKAQAHEGDGRFTRTSIAITETLS